MMRGREHRETYIVPWYLQHPNFLVILIPEALNDVVDCFDRPETGEAISFLGIVNPGDCWGAVNTAATFKHRIDWTSEVLRT